MPPKIDLTNITKFVKYGSRQILKFYENPTQEEYLNQDLLICFITIQFLMIFKDLQDFGLIWFYFEKC